MKTWSDDQERIGVEWEEGIRECKEVYYYGDESLDEENSVVQEL